MQGEELSQEERAEYCAIVVNNSEMLLTLLNDILDISSLECGKIKFNCSSEEIVQVCQHVLMTTAHTRQEGVEGRLECAVGSHMLVTDVHRLSQILINLLTNAGKFTSQGSITLGVEIDEAHREVLFSVADTGPRYSARQTGDGLQPFRETRWQQEEGTGLGLAICRQIAMIFGGRIWVDPTYTAGARFVFAHPIDIRFPEDGENRGGVALWKRRILKVMGKAASFAIGNEPSECGISAWFQLVPQMCRTPREAGCRKVDSVPRYGKKDRTGLHIPSRRRCFPRSYGFPAGNVPVSDNIPAGFAVTFLAHFFACPDLFCYLCAAKPGQLPPMRSRMRRLRLRPSQDSGQTDALPGCCGIIPHGCRIIPQIFCIYLIWYLVDILLSINVLKGCLQFWRKV